MFAFLAVLALLAVPVAAWEVHRHELAAAPPPVAEAAPLPARPGMHPGMRPGGRGQGAAGPEARGALGGEAQARLSPPPGARLTPEQLRERHAGQLPPAKFKGQVPGPRGMASAEGGWISGGVTEGAAGAHPRPQGGMRARSAAPGTATAPEAGATSGTAGSAYPDSGAATGAPTGAYPDSSTVAPGSYPDSSTVAPGSYPDGSTVAPTEDVEF